MADELNAAAAVPLPQDDDGARPRTHPRTRTPATLPLGVGASGTRLCAMRILILHQHVQVSTFWCTAHARHARPPGAADARHEPAQPRRGGLWHGPPRLQATEVPWNCRRYILLPHASRRARVLR